MKIVFNNWTRPPGKEKPPTEGGDKIDLLLRKIGRFDFYINSTNVKASVIMAWNGIAVGAVLLKYEIILGFFLKPLWAYDVASVLLMLVAVSSILSLGFAAWVLHPFLWSTGETRANKGNSLFFFKDISALGIDEYMKREAAAAPEEVARDLMSQVHVLAIGLSAKMTNMQRSVRAIIVAVICFLLLITLKTILIVVCNGQVNLCNFYSLNL